MAKVTKIEDKRVERDHRRQDADPNLKPDRWVRLPDGEMKPEDPGPSIFDV